MPTPLRKTLWLLLILLSPLSAADELSQRLNALTLEVQLSNPGAYEKLSELSSRTMTAAPRQQMRWHVLKCEAALNLDSSSKVQRAIDQGLALAQKLKQPQMIAYMYACEANNMMMQGDQEKALTLINKTIHKEGHGDSRGLSLMRRADIYAELGDLKSSLDDLHQAQAWMESLHSKVPIYQPHPAMITYSLARTYFYLGDYARSDRLFQQAVTEAPKGSSLTWIIQVNHTLTLMQQQRYQEANSRMENLKTLAPQMDKNALARFNLLFAHLSLKLSNYREAYDYASFAIATFREIGMDERQARAQSMAAAAAFHLKRFDEAFGLLNRSREYYQANEDKRILSELNRIESEGEALQGNYRKAYTLQLAYHDAFVLQQETLRKEALLQQQIQLEQKIDRNRAQLASHSSSYFELHNQLMVWQAMACLSLLLWVIWLLFTLTSSRKNAELAQDYELQHWRTQLETALASTDRTLPVVKFTWEGDGLTDKLRKAIRDKEIRADDWMIECGERQLIVLLIAASEAEAERLRYRLSRLLANSGYTHISTGVARTHPLEKTDSLLARLECNQIQHGLMLSDNVIRPDKPQWHQ